MDLPKEVLGSECGSINNGGVGSVGDAFWDGSANPAFCLVYSPMFGGLLVILSKYFPYQSQIITGSLIT